MRSIIPHTRFGLMGTPAQWPAGDGPDVLLGQLRRPVAIPQGEGLPDITQATRLFDLRQAETRAARAEQRRPQFVTPQAVNAEEAQARLAHATASAEPLHERLALHWANHFSVSVGFRTGYLAGDMDRMAIRPHMLGRFRDLLRACITHPAMLAYLTNFLSMGPNSTVGRRQRRGLNENLARELLELHTLGADGGYTQADVLETARILTGWTVPTTTSRGTNLTFLPERHEPGARVVLGRRYPEGGQEQLLALLDDLAIHPATARHVARRLVRHFLGDTAPPAVAEDLARVFQRTEGDLRAVTEALVTHPVSWSLPPRKLRPPVELVFSLSRMLGGLPARPPLALMLRAMGQPWKGATSPAGWPEADDAWAAPDAVKSRLDWAVVVAARSEPTLDARALAEASFGDALSRETRLTLRRAATGEQALALLIMSPEMQRR
jgi:uncharacterized protein (DUF1800 family)